MKNDKSAVDDFLQGLNKPNDNPLESSDPFATVVEEKEEEKGVVEEGVKQDEKPLPFHKDPKVLRFIEKEVEKRTPKAQETRNERSDDTDEVTAVLERIIGNDTPEKMQGVKDLRRVLGGMEEKAAERALKQFQDQAQAQVEEERAAQRQLDESFEEIEDTFSVDLSSNTPQARKTRSEFVDYIRKIAPKNQDGEVAAFPDLNAAFEEFQERQKRSVTPNRAKDLASRSMTRSSDTTVTPPVTDKSWKGVEKLFNKLS